MNEAWRDELHALTNALGVEHKKHQPAPIGGRPKTQYSETTGRLIPPPSRAMSRGGLMSRREQAGTGTLHNFGVEEPDTEQMVGHH